MKPLITQIAVDAAILALLYLGFYQNIDGARNVIVFLCCAALPLNMLTCYMVLRGEASVTQHMNGIKPITACLTHLKAAVILITLVWHGYHVTAGIYLIAWLCLAMSIRLARATPTHNPTSPKR